MLPLPSDLKHWAKITKKSASVFGYALPLIRAETRIQMQREKKRENLKKETETRTVDIVLY